MHGKTEGIWGVGCEARAASGAVEGESGRFDLNRRAVGSPVGWLEIST